MQNLTKFSIQSNFNRKILIYKKNSKNSIKMHNDLNLCFSSYRCSNSHSLFIFTIPNSNSVKLYEWSKHRKIKHRFELSTIPTWFLMHYYTKKRALKYFCFLEFFCLDIYSRNCYFCNIRKQLAHVCIWNLTLRKNLKEFIELFP